MSVFKKKQEFDKKPYFSLWKKWKTDTKKRTVVDDLNKNRDNPKKLDGYRHIVRLLKWIGPITSVILGFLCFILWFQLSFVSHASQTSLDIGIGDMFNTYDNDYILGLTGAVWAGWSNLIYLELAFLGGWALIYQSLILIDYGFYHKENKDLLKKQIKIVKKQKELNAELRKRKQITTYEEFLKLIPTDFQVTVYKDIDDLHNNPGYVVKTGVTADKQEIRDLERGIISKRMFEEKASDIINGLKTSYDQNQKANPNFVFYVVTATNKNVNHCFNEGETGSGKTVMFVSVEVAHFLKSRKPLSVMCTIKYGDEKLLLAQARALNYDVAYYNLESPSDSSKFNPLALLFFYNQLYLQLKFASSNVRPLTSLSPQDIKNSVDIRIKKRSTNEKTECKIEVIRTIRTKKELIEKLINYTNDSSIATFYPNWEDNKVSFYDLYSAFRSWQNNEYRILNISPHFLMTDDFQYWTEDRMKNVKNSIVVGNWLFKDKQHFIAKKEALMGTVKEQVDSLLEAFTKTMFEDMRKGAKDTFWVTSAENIVIGFFKLFLEFSEMPDFTDGAFSFSEEYFNLPNIATWINDAFLDAKVAKETVLNPNAMAKSKTLESSKGAWNKAGNEEQEEFATIMTTVNSVFQRYTYTSSSGPMIIRSDFNPLDFVLTPTFALISVAANEDAPANTLMPLIIDAYDNATEFISKFNGGSSPIPLRYVLDEAGSSAPPPWKFVNKALTLGRFKQILVDLYYQTISQVDRAYLSDKNPKPLETFGSNVQLYRCIKTKTTDSANYWAELFGKDVSFKLNSTEDDKTLQFNSEEYIFSPNELKTKAPWETVIKVNNRNFEFCSAPFFLTKYAEKLREYEKKVAQQTLTFEKRKFVGEDFYFDYHNRIEDIFKCLINGKSAQDKFVYVEFGNLMSDTTLFNRRFKNTTEKNLSSTDLSHICNDYNNHHATADAEKYTNQTIEGAFDDSDNTMSIPNEDPDFDDPKILHQEQPPRWQKESRQYRSSKPSKKELAARWTNDRDSAYYGKNVSSSNRPSVAFESQEDENNYDDLGDYD